VEVEGAVVEVEGAVVGAVDGAIMGAVGVHSKSHVVLVNNFHARGYLGPK
jgi:hypothetical protein